MILALFLVPAAASLLALLVRSHPGRRALLVGTAAAHAGLVAWRWLDAPRFGPVGDWLALDAAGLLVLSIVCILFTASAVSTAATMSRTPADDADGRRQTVLVACLPGFLAAMTLVCLSRHAGLLWVAVEATTLVSAPLVGLHRSARSLEATWKYLLVCSVGIAVALLGTYFLAAAASSVDGGTVPFAFPQLIAGAGRLDPRWLKAAFILVLVGYGTKMGLVPFHTWLPDAHSEAPSAVSALLSGALLNCAFLGVLRFTGICEAAGLGQFARETLVQVGLLTMVVASALLLGQADYKRMLAWSSVEHMGILAVGIGLGGSGAWGSLFHAANHSLVKAALFLAAGNILAVYGSKRVEDVRGVLRTAPVTGTLWVLGLFAITGAPPFGTFVGELAILRSAADRGSWIVAAVYLVALVAAFVGMVSVMLRMAQGAPPGADRPVAAPSQTPAAALATPGFLLAASLALGLVSPNFFNSLISQALEGLHL
jgi:hydrogenase-4 component F